MLQKTDLTGLLQSSLLAASQASQTPKPETMTGALQLLQSKSPAMDSFSSLPPSSTMDSLSDSELKTLLQNFKDLSTEEQHSLITYLKKLEAKEPDRVERLRKFVNLGPNKESDEKAYTSSGRVSPFSNREAGANPSVDDLDEPVNKPNPATTTTKPPEKLNIDSDEDEDYSYEDVFRAASKNVNEKQLEEKRIEDSKKIPETSNVNLNDTKMLIANLMGQLGQKNSTLNLLGLTNQQNKKPLMLDCISDAAASTFPPMKSSPIPTITSATQFVKPGPGSNPIQPVGFLNPVNPNINQQAPFGAQPPAGQYNYANSRQYNVGYDNSYQNNYQNNQQMPQTGGYNMDQNAADYNNYGGNNSGDYMNYGQQQMNNPRMPQQYGRGPPNQYQQYDGRQNYY